MQSGPSELFKLLSDDIRLKTLLLILHETQLCVCELMVALDEPSQPKVSRHLAVLRKAGVLLDKKQKQWVYYSLSPKLPAWFVAVLENLTQTQTHYFATELARLNKMGDRPKRIATCCV